MTTKQYPPLIILTGESGAGKSTFVDCLDCKDNNWYESSREIVKLVQKRGESVTHDSIHKVATEKYTENPYWQVPMILSELEGKDFLIYDGPRRIAEVRRLIKQYPNIALVKIIADDSVRLERLRARDGITEKDFKRIKQHESKETQLGQILDLAVVIIENNGTLTQLQQKANNFREQFNF